MFHTVIAKKELWETIFMSNEFRMHYQFVNWSVKVLHILDASVVIVLSLSHQSPHINNKEIFSISTCYVI